MPFSCSFSAGIKFANYYLTTCSALFFPPHEQEIKCQESLHISCDPICERCDPSEDIRSSFGTRNPPRDHSTHLTRCHFHQRTTRITFAGTLVFTVQRANVLRETDRRSYLEKVTGDALEVGNRVQVGTFQLLGDVSWELNQIERRLILRELNPKFPFLTLVNPQPVSNIVCPPST